jgi:hypothetical protein
VFENITVYKWKSDCFNLSVLARMSGTVEIVIKPTVTGDRSDRFNVTISNDATVLELKEEVAKHCELSAEEQRLIYKGQVMKDHNTVSSYGALSGQPPKLVCNPFETM